MDERNPAPSKGWFRAYKYWDVDHISTGAGHFVSSTVSRVGGIPTPLKNMTSSVGSMKFPTGWNKIHSCSKPPIKYCTIDYYRLLTIIINQLCYYNHVPNHPPNHVVSAHPVVLPLFAGSNLPPCSLWPVAKGHSLGPVPKTSAQTIPGPWHGFV